MNFPPLEIGPEILSRLTEFNIEYAVHVILIVSNYTKYIFPSLQNTSTNLYIHALALTADLAEETSNWLTLYSELLSKKQVQMIIALALFTGDREVKLKVLQLTSSIEFPQEW